MNQRLLWETLAEDLGAGFAENRELHRAVLRLSRSFTEGREALEPDYFSVPLLRRAYLAYFLPLGFAKVETLLLAHKGWLPPRTREPTAFRILDFGCGPATATLAALDALERTVKSPAAPPITVDLVDPQPEALEIAKKLVTRFAQKLRLEAEVRTFQELPEDSDERSRYDLVMAINVLNELPPEEGVRGRETLIRLWERAFGSMLIVEPSHRVASQRMVRFRERLLKSHSSDGAVPRGVRILGPCMHLGACPVNRTKNWCHFSEPALDSRLQDLSARIFKDPRKWLKFSYLFFKREAFAPLALRWTPSLTAAAKEESMKTEEWDRLTYRAIGDLHPVGGARPERRISHGHRSGHRAKTLAIDLCRPRDKFVLALPAAALSQALREKLVRGAVVTITAENKIDSTTMTRRNRRPGATMRPPGA